MPVLNRNYLSQMEVLKAKPELLDIGELSWSLFIRIKKKK